MSNRNFEVIIEAMEKCAWNGAGCIGCDAQKLCDLLFLKLKKLNRPVPKPEKPWRSSSGHF